jgi:poly-gamma-glutamate synthesis protein (capsule biosynthesis protein)
LDKSRSILFLGDVVPYKPFVFRNTYKTIINLECPITTIGKPVTGKINLSVSENHLPLIFRNTLLCINVSNNHILDFGVEGLRSTISEIRKMDIGFFGVDHFEGNSYNPVILKYGNMRIALFSALCETTSPVTGFNNSSLLSLIDSDELIEKLSETRKLADRIVIYIHWGLEESSYPTSGDIAKARKLIDCGVDLVIGSHAHAPQAIEKYKNGVIAYNLGNFIMPGMNRIPSYYDEKGRPQSTYLKRIMLWNRISWGFLVDMETLEFKIRKYMFLGDRIVNMPFTPLDRFISLKYDKSADSYENIISKHLKRRKLVRKLWDFICEPHVPQKIKKLI